MCKLIQACAGPFTWDHMPLCAKTEYDMRVGLFKRGDDTFSDQFLRLSSLYLFYCKDCVICLNISLFSYSSPILYGKVILGNKSSLPCDVTKQKKSKCTLFLERCAIACACAGTHTSKFTWVIYHTCEIIVFSLFVLLLLHYFL